MSAVIPDDEDVFYTIGFLHSSRLDEWEAFDVQNKDILQFCYNAGIEVKQYLPNYNTKEEWAKNHFGMKWTTFQERKHLFDPKMILSPGHSDGVRQRASPRHGLINYRIVVSITVKLFFSES
jgi:cytokinin dehydrogenase